MEVGGVIMNRCEVGAVCGRGEVGKGDPIAQGVSSDVVSLQHVESPTCC